MKRAPAVWLHTERCDDLAHTSRVECARPLQVRDILLEIDGVRIANDSTIQLPGTHDLVRVTFSYLVWPREDRPSHSPPTQP